MPRKQYKYHFIYKTTCLLNENYYVGMHSTSDLDDGYMGSGKRLKRSIKKYGKEQFKREILEFLESRDLLKKRESELVNDDLLKDLKCMNIQHGGGGGFSSEEHARKFHRAGAIKNRMIAMNAHLNKLASDNEYRKKFSEAIRAGRTGSGFDGKKHSQETKDLIKSIFFKNKHQQKEKNSQYNTCWIYNDKLKLSKKVKKSELNDHLIDDWQVGRKIRFKDVDL